MENMEDAINEWNIAEIEKELIFTMLSLFVIELQVVQGIEKGVFV